MVLRSAVGVLKWSVDSARAFKLTFILSIIAAALASAAAVIRYISHGEINFSLIGAGIFVLAFGFAAKTRS